MRTNRNLLTILAATTAPAIAGQAGPQDGSLLVAMFVGFAGLVIFFQLIPAVVIFFTFVKELFTPTPHSPEPRETER